MPLLHATKGGHDAPGVRGIRHRREGEYWHGESRQYGCWARRASHEAVVLRLRASLRFAQALHVTSGVAPPCRRRRDANSICWGSYIYYCCHILSDEDSTCYDSILLFHHYHCLHLYFAISLSFVSIITSIFVIFERILLRYYHTLSLLSLMLTEYHRYLFYATHYYYYCRRLAMPHNISLPYIIIITPKTLFHAYASETQPLRHIISHYHIIIAITTTVSIFHAFVIITICRMPLLYFASYYIYCRSAISYMLFYYFSLIRHYTLLSITNRIFHYITTPHIHTHLYYY